MWYIYIHTHTHTHTHTTGYHLGIKKNEIMPSAVTWMQLDITILSEVSQTKTNMISLICGILKKNTTQLIYKTNRLTDIENKLKVTRGAKGWGR